MEIEKSKIVSLQAKISDTPFDQKFLLTSRSGCFAMAQTDRQTDRQTDGHQDSMTESA